MKVIALGASVIAGTELSCAENVWPSLYAKSCGASFENLAKVGCSNQYVLRTLLENIQHQNEQCFYIIHWPTSIRFEYVNKENDTWIQISPNVSDSLVSKIYYGEINSYLGDKWNTLLMIYSAQQALKNLNHKFAMTVDDDFLYDTQWHNPDYVKFLQDNTKNSILWFEGKVWSVWAKNQGFLHGPGNHPLDEAHLSAATLLQPMYNKFLHT